MIRRLICPSPYTATSQLVISFSAGLLLSWWSFNLVYLLLWFVVAEFLVYSLMGYSYWFPLARIGAVVAYIAGWIIGRTIFHQKIVFISEEHDREYLGAHAMC